VCSLPHFSDWPRIQTQIARNEKEDATVAGILGLMTLEEKVGQMIQPEMQQLTPEEAGEFRLIRIGKLPLKNGPR